MTRTASTAEVNAIASGVPRYAPAAPRPAATSTSPITSRPAASATIDTPTGRNSPSPTRTPRWMHRSSQSETVGTVAAAAQYASTPIARASGSRNRPPASASAIVSSASRTVQRRIVALSSPLPAERARRHRARRRHLERGARDGEDQEARERSGQDAVVRAPQHAREDGGEDHGDAVGDELRRGETGGGGRLRAARNGGRRRSRRSPAHGGDGSSEIGRGRSLRG